MNRVNGLLNTVGRFYLRFVPVYGELVVIRMTPNGNECLRGAMPEGMAAMSKNISCPPSYTDRRQNILVFGTYAGEEFIYYSARPEVSSLDRVVPYVKVPYNDSIIRADSLRTGSKTHQSKQFPGMLARAWWADDWYPTPAQPVPALRKLYNTYGLAPWDRAIWLSDAGEWDYVKDGD